MENNQKLENVEMGNVKTKNNLKLILIIGIIVICAVGATVAIMKIKNGNNDNSKVQDENGNEIGVINNVKNNNIRIETGTYVVGQDIKAGVYVFKLNKGKMQRKKDEKIEERDVDLSACVNCKKQGAEKWEEVVDEEGGRIKVEDGDSIEVKIKTFIYSSDKVIDEPYWTY